ncbi:hypothetical protein MHU86_1283 [Fragilaria crotonensis]|nr:hypothetical protein MHU86_1283 [Fragilaria crotonensis]
MLPQTLRRVPVAEWHQLLPGLRGLFFALAIADSLQSGPTRFRELLSVGPHIAHRACDACQHGMGIWFFPVMRLPGLGAQRIRHVQYRPIVSPPRPQRPAPATPAALCPLVHGHIAGKAKSVMANDASCRWDGDLAPRAKLVSHFNSVYLRPPPGGC